MKNQEVVTKWTCQRACRGGYLVSSEKFKVTGKVFTMLKPKEQSSDSEWAFGYITRFTHDDPRLSDSAEQAIVKLVTTEQSNIETLRGKIAKSQERITEVRHFLAQWKLENPSPSMG